MSETKKSTKTRTLRLVLEIEITEEIWDGATPYTDWLARCLEDKEDWSDYIGDEWWIDHMFTPPGDYNEDPYNMAMHYRGEDNRMIYQYLEGGVEMKMSIRPYAGQRWGVGESHLR